MGRVTRVWRPRGLPSGVYYVSAKLGERRQIRKLVWLGDRRWRCGSYPMIVTRTTA